jgi:hypothetical protein
MKYGLKDSSNGINTGVSKEAVDEGGKLSDPLNTSVPGSPGPQKPARDAKWLMSYNPSF